MIQAWEEACRSFESRDQTEAETKKACLVLNSIVLNARSFTFLIKVLVDERPEPSSRLQNLCLQDVTIAENDAPVVTKDLATFIQLNECSLQELSLQFASLRWGWSRTSETRAFIHSLNQQDQFSTFRMLRKVSFQNVDLSGREAGQCLARLLVEAPIQEVCFRYCCLDMPMVAHLSKGMKQSQTLHTFQLMFLPIVYTRHAAEAIESVSFPVLKTLAELRNLKSLSLAMEAVYCSALPTMAKILASNPKLEDVRLEISQMFGHSSAYIGPRCTPPSDNEMQPFSTAIQQHASLRVLYLSGCKMGAYVANKILQVLEHNHHLEELWLQNTRNNHHLSCGDEWVESLPKLHHLRTLALPNGILEHDPKFSNLVQALRQNVSLNACYFYVPPTDVRFLHSTNATSSIIQPIVRRNQFFQRIHSSQGLPPSATWPILLQRMDHTCEDGASLIFSFLKLETFCNMKPHFR